MTDYNGAEVIDQESFKEDWDYFMAKYGNADADMLQGLMSFSAIAAIVKKAFKLDDFEVSLDDDIDLG